jgi:cell division protein FtsZ
MDRRKFLLGAGAGIAGLSLPAMASPAWSQRPPIPETSLWSGSNGRTAGSCRVIGIGGAGCNIVRAAWSSAVWENADQRPEFSCVDLGEHALRYVAAASANHPERAPIKTLSLAPVGAGGWVNGARAMALRQREALKALVADADMVVLVAGLGGGTGSGVTPIMVRLAREAGALTIAIVVTPFAYEGVRQRKASTAIRYLKRETNLVMEFSNEGWAKLQSDDTPMIDVLTSLDRHIPGSIRGLTEWYNTINCPKVEDVIKHQRNEDS